MTRLWLLWFVDKERQMQQSKTFPATLKSVSEFTSQLETTLDGLSNDFRVTLILAVQELCVNIVEHAYAGTAGIIRVDIDWSGNTIKLMMRDQAPNRFVQPDEIALPDPLELSEGGLGLFIIYQTFDRIDYKRLPDGNQWHLSKSLGGQ